MRFFALLLVASVGAACARTPDYGYGDDPSPYEDYKALRAEAAERCTKLGWIPGSPEHRCCTGTQYTRLKSGQ